MKISMLSKVMLFIATLLLVGSIFVPIWRIDLDAPQYPEGLYLLIYADNIGGNVDIINGLNHYIGMKTLHTEDFIEFSILKYIIIFYALFTFVSMIVGRKKLLYILFTAFVIFGIVAMVDFWRWEYNYGHNLDPNAAIIVPGMAYQPPLIGFKQLLNFGAYSMPDMGGWFFVGSGLLMLIAVVKESNILSKFLKKKKSSLVSIIPLILVLNSCSNNGPIPIKVNSDKCDFCKMNISVLKFSGEIITKKGRVYKFDDISCMANFKKEQKNIEVDKLYISDYEKDNSLIPVENAFLLTSESIKSPMGGNVAAYSNEKVRNELMKQNHSEIITWNQLISE